MEIPKISDAEYEIMEVIWCDAPINTNQVVEKLKKRSNWSAKTIQTMLTRLVKKGALNYYKDSRIFVYEPVFSKELYVETQSSHFLKQYFQGTLNSMVLNFVEKDKITAAEIEELQQILERKKRQL